jgi:dephospho-CoA kinase
VVGLTGGLASGKSSVARLLGQRGVPVLDADREVHRLYRAGGVGAAAVAELFGAGMLTDSGAVDRDALARRVVGDENALDLLNRAIHPLVRTAVDDWVRTLASAPEPPPVVVVEVALLVETGGGRRYDVLLVVGCRPDQQLARALARGMEADRARGLLAAQIAIGDKIAAADVVIDNSGTAADLEAEVDRAWREVLALCDARRRGERSREMDDGRPSDPR